MTSTVEQDHILNFELLGPQVEYPDFPYNGVEKGIRQAVGLVVLRINPQGEIEVLLGKHKSRRNPYKDNRWSWFGETRDEENDWGTFDTLVRLTSEELARNLATLRFFVDGRKPLMYPMLLTEGDRTLDSNMLVVYSNENLAGYISPVGEVEETEYERLEDLLSDETDKLLRTEKLLREYTRDALEKLREQGAFEIPVTPLRRLVMPKKI